MEQVERPGRLNLKQCDTLLLVGFLLGGILTRVPFRSRMLYHWDSVNFALGIERFDIQMHQPHPPGYFLYVMLGRAVDAVIQDPNASLVWLSVIFSGLTAGGLFLLGKAMFSRWEGVIAALALLSSPLFWFHGEVALMYVLEAFFTTIIALMSTQLLAGRRQYLYPSALILGIAGGIRQSTLLFMFPLWLFSIRKLSLKRVALAVLLLALVVGAWLVPMVVLTGGVDRYLGLSRGTDVVGESSLLDPRQVVFNAARIGAYGFYGLLLGGIPLAYSVLRGLRALPASARDRRAQVIAVWVIPSLLFLIFVHIRQAGHIFVFLPALFLLVGVGMVRISHALVERVWSPSKRQLQAGETVMSRRGRATLMAGVILLLATNTLFFLAAPPYLLGIERTVLHTPSFRSIRSQDRYLSEAVGYIRGNLPPEKTVILAGGFSFRQPDYYLPEYTIVRYSDEELDAVDRSYTTVLFGQMEVWGPEGAERVLLSGGDALVYIPASGE